MAEGWRRGRARLTTAWHWVSAGPGRQPLTAVRRRPLAAAAVTVLVLAAGSAAVLAGRGPALSARDRNWQRDVAYLARELPPAHAGGLTSVSRAAWMIPDIMVAPTLSDWLAGQDPVLAEALAYGQSRGS
jgi:hypothetical protein